MKRSTREAHDLALRTTDLERRLVEAQLQSLRAQMQPHFLFNALNTISAFTESNPQMARRLMAQLGDLLRASLRHAAQPLVTLAEELTFLDDFLAIESARFEGRIHVSVQADDDVLPMMVPGFLLQPLVENAIRHGVGPRLSGGHVAVTATRDRSTVRIRVRDDGVGLPADMELRPRRRRRSQERERAPRAHVRTARPGAARGLSSGGVEVQVDLPGGGPAGPLTTGDVASLGQDYAKHPRVDCRRREAGT